MFCDLCYTDGTPLFETHYLVTRKIELTTEKADQ